MAKETKRMKTTFHRDVRGEPDREHGEQLGKLLAVETLEGEVEVTVDWDRLALELGRNAHRSKGKKSVDAAGKVEAKAVGAPTVISRRECP